MYLGGQIGTWLGNFLIFISLARCCKGELDRHCQFVIHVLVRWVNVVCALWKVPSEYVGFRKRAKTCKALLGFLFSFPGCLLLACVDLFLFSAS